MDKLVKRINFVLIIFLIILLPLFFLNKVYDNYFDIEYHQVLWKLSPIFICIYIYSILRKNIKIGVIDILVYIMIILNIISCYYAIDKKMAIYGTDIRYEGFYSLLAYYSIFFSCKCLRGRKYIEGILQSFLLVGLFQFIYCVIQVYFKDLLTNSMLFTFSSNMANGFINNPNFTGSLIILLLGIFVMKYLTYDKGFILHLIISIFFFINLLLCQSTGPFLGSVFMVIFVLIFLIIKRKLKIFRYIMLIGSFVLCYFLVDYSYKHIDGLKELDKNYTISYDLKQLYRAINGEMVIFDIPENDFSYDMSNLPVKNEDNLNGLGSGRIMIWRNSMKLIPKYYLFGCGIDNFGLAYKWHYDYVYYDKAHNDFLQILITRGVFSLVTYLLFLLMLFIKALKSNDNLMWALFLGIISYAAQSFTNISIVNVAPYFYMLCGLMLALLNKKSNKVMIDEKN